MTLEEALEELIRTCRALDRDGVTQAEFDAEWERMTSLAEQVKAGGSHLELEGLAMMAMMRPARTPSPRRKRTTKKPPREFEPPGESLADELIGSDPEPEGGWRNFDENGKRIPSTALPKPQPKPDKPQPTKAKAKRSKGKGSK